MRPKRPPVQGVIPSLGRLVIDASSDVPAPALLVDISGATIGEAEARLCRHSAHHGTPHTALRSDRDSATVGRSGPAIQGDEAMKQAFPIDHAVPISKAIRAGDFVFTSAFGPWVFDPANLTFDDAGNILDDGTGNQSMRFERAGSPHLRLHQGGAGCCRLHPRRRRQLRMLADRSARFRRLQRDLQDLFQVKDPPVRSIFPMRFMFNCKVEMKVVAYKPLTA